MRSRLTATLASCIFLVSCGCSGGGGGVTDGGTQADGGTPGDAGTHTDGGTPADTATPADAGPAPDGQSDAASPPADGGAGHGLGAACSCTGTGCSQMGVPKPTGGTIVGCEDVPTGVAGTALACLRSYGGSLATDTYFANGYCALMATQCSGASLICDAAVFGNYAAMTACPAGSVMISDSQAVNVLGQQATISNKVCVKKCTGDGDCRTGETDPVLGNTATQYQCIDKGGVKFCYDPRNLSNSYTATAF